MGTTPKLAAGEEFVAGRSQAKAKELVLLAEAAGLKGSVKTTYNGYIFPSAILAGATPENAVIGGTIVEDQDEDQDADENPEGVLFDPSTATIAEVKEYLAGADDAERTRVIDAEKASTKPRTGVLELATIPEGAK